MADTGADRRVSVLGARSLVGACLLPLLAQAGWQVTAYSRRAARPAGDGMSWRQIKDAPSPLVPFPMREGSSLDWVCAAPIWVLPKYFALLEAQGTRRVVVLSSTSRYTKDDSSDPEEQAVARRLAEAEARVQAWAESRGVEWTILRPTLIYGLGRDKNIAELARFIRRFGFFPVFGKAGGLRQPVHAEDVAGACVAALRSAAAGNHAYNLSGGEILPYREMVGRIFVAMKRRPRQVTVPLSAFRLAVFCLRWFPRYRNWSAAMAERMNRDMVFGHADAARDLNFSPRPFQIADDDLSA